ncbi:hypothetical protein Tco_0306039, partial [Tanacetum coccineum]
PASLVAISQILYVLIEKEFYLNSEMTWRTTERQWSADIDSDLITFRIRLVYLISKHLVTLLHLELQYQFMKVVMSPILASDEFSAGGS